MGTSGEVNGAELSADALQEIEGGQSSVAGDFWKAVGYAVGTMFYYAVNGEVAEGGWSSWHS